MRRVLAALTLALALPPGATAAGEPSGVDTQALDQCLADAATDGARLDCAGSAQPACLTYAETRHPEMHPVDRQLHCIDAEWQYWETRLNDTYTALKATEDARGADRAAALVAMERGWIAFRDTRCAYDRLTNGRGTGGAVAEPLCRLNETARQVILLDAYRRDRGE